MANPQVAEFRRPPKHRRRRPVPLATEEVRQTITKTLEDIKRGFHAERSFLRDGWEIDESSRIKDGVGGEVFDVVISAEKWNALRMARQKRTDSQAGMKPDLPGGVESAKVTTERISGATMRRELEQAASDEAE